jgi:phosphoenolpyruvate-protein kinase (PTS system EI component)
MLQGLSVSPGVAVGRAVIVRFDGVPTYRRALSSGELDEEERRLRRAARRGASAAIRPLREAESATSSPRFSRRTR